MRSLIGEQMMLHLCLTGWVSTERDWHQDDYLNPPFVNSWYAAVWMALGDIHPDSGPFEYVPGSHRWPLMRGDKIRARMPWRQATQPNWPAVSESFVVPAVEAEIERRGAIVRPFIAKRGDVLIWHGRLLHRGSKPKQPGMMRNSLICHYSGITHRKDKPTRARDANGQLYWITKPRSAVRRGLHALKVLKEQVTARMGTF
jgi:ectoine hydroxylase-related dioxygenase (phytanoyl-CoA dioxygenase family)